MLKFNKLLLVILLLCGQLIMHGQDNGDFDFVSTMVKHKTKPSTYSTYQQQINKNSNEAELLISTLFFAYKEFFSSQDANRCAFYPSCSLYSILAFKEGGIVKGGIMTFDRLSRCNGFSMEKYTLDPNKKALIDPVKW